MKWKKLNAQMSESLVNAIFLLMSGGFQDAYTYFFRGKVFANAQTGNIVLMSSYLFQLDLKHALYYCIPLVSFAVGVFVAELIHYHCKEMKKVHWRQLILVAEIVFLFMVGFIPDSLHTIANAVVSFVCAMQVQSFKKVNGRSYASTMCIGNMRSMMETLCVYVNTKDKKALKSFLHYFIVIFVFGMGAGLGYVFSKLFGAKAIWFSCVLLMISFCIMTIKEKSEVKEDEKKTELLMSQN